MIPRPYQVEAVAAARKALAERGSALLALPTGSGKTAIAGFVIAEEADADPQARSKYEASCALNFAWNLSAIQRAVASVR